MSTYLLSVGGEGGCPGGAGFCQSQSESYAYRRPASTDWLHIWQNFNVTIIHTVKGKGKLIIKSFQQLLF